MTRHKKKMGFKTRKRQRFLRWDRRGSSAASCWYCGIVHQKKYSKMNKSALKKHLKEQNDKGELENYKLFMARVNKSKDVLCQGDGERYGPGQWELEVAAKATVTASKKQLASRKRRGKWYRMDVFVSLFPGSNAKQAGKVLKSLNKKGVEETWVKVYNKKEGTMAFLAAASPS